MNKIKSRLVEGWNKETFEQNLQFSLDTIHSNQLIEVKFNTIVNNKDQIHYSALIVYRAVR